MAEPTLSSRARADLDTAWDHISAHSPDAADRFLDDFWARAHVHAGSPRLGRPRDEVRPGLRSFVVGRYVAFFQPTGGTIEVVRVIYGSRDIPAAFDEG